jgi:hypothetical protein
VNILDENIPKNQRQLLETWRIHVRQIGFNIGQRGMQDEEIIPFLLQRRHSTFFTRDEVFAIPGLTPKPSEWARSFALHAQAFLFGFSTVNMKCASAGTTNQRSAGCGTWAQLFSSQIQNQTEIRSRRSLKISMSELV